MVETIYNPLPVDFEGPQKRRTDFGSQEELDAFDAQGLVAIARRGFQRFNVTVDDVLAQSRREEDRGRLREPIAHDLAETGDAGIRTLFESPEVGYDHALQVLRGGKIDPDSLPKGSETLWDSREAALAELLGHLSPDMLRAIAEHYKDPIIAVSPRMLSDRIFRPVKKVHASTDDALHIRYSFEQSAALNVGFTTDNGTCSSNYSGSLSDLLRRADEANKVGEADGRKIIGWRMGIVDRAPNPPLTLEKFLEQPVLKDLGFRSLLDDPILYAMLLRDTIDRGRDRTVSLDTIAGTPGSSRDSMGQPISLAASYKLDQGAVRVSDTNGRHPKFFNVPLALMFDKQS